jgi:pimeloyl-ACP methyl ester carboxylesterase
VLLPGWGFDARIFEPLDLAFDYLLPQRIDTERFNAELILALERKGLKEVSLFGWSMGGFLALDFLKEYGEAVRAVFLVSMRTRFPKKQIDAQRSLLMADRKLYLGQFYRNCFMGQKRAFAWFERKLLSSYIKIFDLQSLLKGLDYMVRQALRPSLLKGHPILLIHGKKDRLAPFSEISESMAGLSFPHILLFEKSGHLPFLEPDFK